MKRFLIEIDDDAWKEICRKQKRAYERDDYDYGTMPIPPTDDKVFYDYLFLRAGVCRHAHDELHGMTVSEART